MTMWITLVAMYAGGACCAPCCAWLFDWAGGLSARCCTLPWPVAASCCSHRADVAPLWLKCRALPWQRTCAKPPGCLRGPSVLFLVTHKLPEAAGEKAGLQPQKQQYVWSMGDSLHPQHRVLWSAFLDPSSLHKAACSCSSADNRTLQATVCSAASSLPSGGGITPESLQHTCSLHIS